MPNLLKELKELEAAIEHANQISCSNTVSDCAKEHFQLAGWLQELLDIKNARLITEVYNNQEPVPEMIEEIWSGDSDELPSPCFRCSSQAGVEERDCRMVCSSCGATQRE